MKTGTQREVLPAEEDMNRDDALRAFVAAVNLANPEHEKLGERLTSLAQENVNYKSTRTSFARCGPRDMIKRGRKILVMYATRLTYINTITRERHLAILAHEMTHLKYHNNTEEGGGTHTDRFWDEYAFNASELRDVVTTGDTVFGAVDDDELCHEIIHDPNPATVDRRRSSVADVEQRIAELIGEPGACEKE